MSLLFNMLFGLVITFLPRSNHLLISWLESLSEMILEPESIVYHCFHCLPISLPWSDGTRWHDLFSWKLDFKPTFSLSLLLSSRSTLILLRFCHKGGIICISEVIDISPCNLDSSLFFIHLYFFALRTEEGFLISPAILWNSAFKWSLPLYSFAFSYSPWRRQWQPTPVLLPGKSHGWRSLVGYSP